MNKILLINPPQSCDIKAKHSYFKFPLGLLYIADYLEKNNFSVKILDCPLYYKKRRKIDKENVRMGLFPEEIKKEIKEFNPDIIGVSCAYSAYEADSFEVIKIAREAEKELKKRFLVIVGGAHVSANPEYVLRNKDIDIAVIGEGEETILEIAQKYKQEKLENIKGTATRIKGKIRINEKRGFIKNLDKLKPAWHLLDMKKYFEHPDNSKATLRKPSVDIITSRGCPGNCVFCSIHTVWGRVWRGRSVKNVVDEMELLVKKYKARQFRIQDDNLTLDRKRIIEICDEIIKRKMDIRWDTPNGIAIWTLDEQVLEKMKQSGCYRITFGVESGSKKTQEYIRKIIDSDKIRRLIDYCHKTGIWVCATFIIGFPYERKEDIRKTREFILNSRINFPFVYIAQPYPGTDMYEDFKKEKLMKDVREISNLKKSRYNTLYFSNKELIKMQKSIYKKFYMKKMLLYMNPLVFYREFISKIRKMEDFSYALKNLFNVVSG